jgi:hypothetical protein
MRSMIGLRYVWEGREGCEAAVPTGTDEGGWANEAPAAIITIKPMIERNMLSPLCDR